MTRSSRVGAASFLVALSVAFAHPASAAGASGAMTLSDAQLDQIAAGSKATAKGDADAQGDAARSSAAASSQIGGGGLVGMAAGSVTASASGADAVAASSLSLSVIIR